MQRGCARFVARDDEGMFQFVTKIELSDRINMLTQISTSLLGQWSVELTNRYSIQNND